LSCIIDRKLGSKFTGDPFYSKSIYFANRALDGEPIVEWIHNKIRPDDPGYLLLLHPILYRKMIYDTYYPSYDAAAMMQRSTTIIQHLQE